MITVTTTLGSAMPLMPHATGRMYTCPLNAATADLSPVVANQLYAIPVMIPTRNVYTSINLEVTHVQASNGVRLGIWSDSAGVPGALVLDAGTITTASTGGKQISISGTLSAGWYWIGAAMQGTAGVRSVSQSTAMGWLGYTSNTDTTNHVGWGVAFTYGTFPPTFTSGGTLLTGNVPRVMIGL